MRKLPDALKREINRTAHTLAQQSFAAHRHRLEERALQLLRAGRAPDEVLAELRRQAVGG